MLYDTLPGSSPYPYRQLIADTPPLTQEQEHAIVDRLREDYNASGCQGYREELLLRSVPYLSYWTHKYLGVYDCFRLEYVDVLHQACLFFLEKLPAALEKREPLLWLRVMSKWSIQKDCFRHASCIDRPAENGHEPLPDVQSLDAPRSSENAATLADFLVAPSSQETSQPGRDYQPLYQAISSLSPRQQEVVTRYYGLENRSAERLRDILPHIHNPSESHVQALELLRTRVSLEQGALRSELVETYTWPQVCDVLGLSPKTAHSYLKERYGIQPLLRGKYSKPQIDQFAQQRAASKKERRQRENAYALV
ncbi:MAG: hypothetical protein ACRDHW_10960 [Ktedonobacteraceae bacterium]